ncbi:AAA family ATPase [Clostridium chauvoei]|uniref:AAA family ATPase n=1 Tax=Clostridium chauvoei TaxID=46867 RepID=UPI001C865AE0|nr:AAA family ATPase [Clostridium chauvoei]MBX7367298.1 AAA family ATPase [Clostridium chauvoei]
MKPIKLKIKGLNSFIEEQTIDFNKLTDRGFFGIFGPTGSGKSTILDGITLALYGEVSRKSSNYINTNCDKLNVSFEFQISGSEVKKYLVVREFKRDKKTGNPISGKCKIIDITNEEEIILADKVKSVTEKCKEIIGLSLEDFTRTVVLPQGKFSEFLKLEGKSRREMLERLFNLQQYGDNLSRKLSREINKEKTENSVLLGQLMGYEDISEEKKNEKSEELKTSIENLDSVSNELKFIEDKFKENQELWNLQLEINEYKNKEEQLISKAEDIERIKKVIKLGESALKVNPYILTYEDIIRNIEVTEKELKECMSNLENIKEKKLNIEEEWNNARLKKDKELPEYKIREQKVKDALEDRRILINLEKEIESLENKVKDLEKNQELNNKNLITIEGRIEKGNIVVEEEEKRRDSLKIDNEFKNEVQKGLLITNSYEDILKREKDIKIKIEKINNGIKINNESEIKIKNQLDEKKKSLGENEKNLEELIKNCPGNQNDLLELQKLNSESKKAWENFNKYNEEIDKYKKDVINYDIFLKENRERHIKLKEEIEVLKADVKELQIENLANTLRKDLNEGKACPVCGSVEHHKENLKHVELKDVKALEKSIEEKEKTLNELQYEITKVETNKKITEERLEENKKSILDLGEDFKKYSVEQLEKKFIELEKNINNYNIQKENLEKLVTIFKEEYHSLDTKYKQIEARTEEGKKQLNNLKEEYEEVVKILKDNESKLNNIKDKTNVIDFKAKNDEIINKEKEREEAEINIKKYREKIEELITKKDTLVNTLNNIRESLAREKSILQEKDKNRNEKILQIKNKIGDVDNIENLLTHIQEEMKKIENNFINIEKLKEEIEKNYQKYNDMIISLNTKNSELHKNRDRDKEKLDSILKEESFSSIEEVRNNIINKNKINDFKIEIEKYNDELSKVKGTIENLIKKINNRVLTEEQWEKIKQEKDLKKKQVEELSKIKIKVEEEFKNIENKIKELEGLLKQKEKVEHKLALLNDLDKLFKGKKFVEFVAVTRLKYVSIEASKRLKDITNGNYALEVDENGKFIIRDYKNGGAERDASTLSGGETFIASLALALALSTEIQLKGTAPLELFFLDEGFGTLDDNLLDIVMSSLEKIHNDKLKVGIISHVETIKNRVPVKLILTPAESGKGGSKVKIERT